MRDRSSRRHHVRGVAVDEEFADFDLEVMDADSAGADRILAAVSIAPFASPVRLVIVRRAELYRKREFIFLVETWSYFDIGDVVETHLTLLDCPPVEYFRRNHLRSEVNAFLFRLFQCSGEKPHLEFKREYINTRGATLARFRNDFLHE